jgi:hypothetical protein
MNNKIMIFVMTAVMSILLIGSLNAQNKNQYKHIYNTSTVETITGEVQSVDFYSYNKSSAYGGVHITVKTEKETITVHVGPSWYLDDNNFTINLNDKIEVKGSRVKWDSSDVIIAANIKIGDKSLTLRDDDGVPLWSGRKN